MVQSGQRTIAYEIFIKNALNENEHYFYISSSGRGIPLLNTLYNGIQGDPNKIIMSN